MFQSLKRLLARLAPSAAVDRLESRTLDLLAEVWRRTQRDQLAVLVSGGHVLVVQGTPGRIDEMCKTLSESTGDCVLVARPLEFRHHAKCGTGETN